MDRHRLWGGLAVGLLGCALWGISAHSNDSEETPSPGLTTEMLDQMAPLPGEIGPLPAVPIPADNPQTPEKIALGKLLFFDKRLSGDGTISCATCHSPNKGFADGHQFSLGFNKKPLERHTPTVLNSAHNTAQFWDGRAATLEDQAKGPIMADKEMNAGSEKAMVDNLVKARAYPKLFQQVFGEGPTLNNVAKAVASYERTLVTGNSRFDRYAAGDKKALSPAEKRGLLLFVSKANCTACHNGPNFSDNLYHNLGQSDPAADGEDLGRYKITREKKDKAAIKTPTLREIDRTAPYMHKGAVKSLEAVVEFYDKGGGPSAYPKSELIQPLNLTPAEKKDLVAFLHALSGDKFPK